MNMFTCVLHVRGDRGKGDSVVGARWRRVLLQPHCPEKMSLFSGARHRSPRGAVPPYHRALLVTLPALFQLTHLCKPSSLAGLVLGGRGWGTPIPLCRGAQGLRWGRAGGSTAAFPLTSLFQSAFLLTPSQLRLRFIGQGLSDTSPYDIL